MTTTKAAVQDTIGEWFRSRVPDDWFAGPPDVAVDDDEVLVVGSLADEAGDRGDGGDGGDTTARIRAFRERTRDERIRLAAEAEATFGRKVSWGATAGDTRRLFTHLATPVMTRLRLPERKVLDTLIEGGVARSRSEALAWCVRLVAQNQAEWLDDLQAALVNVRTVRTGGPQPD